MIDDRVVRPDPAEVEAIQQVHAKLSWNHKESWWNKAQQTDYTVPSLSSNLVFALYYAKQSNHNCNQCIII